MNEHIVDEWVKFSKKDARFGFFNEYPLDERVYRLFAVACCREAWNELTDERSRKAVETAERYADGLASKKELEKVRNAAWSAWREINIAYTMAAHATSDYGASYATVYTAFYSSAFVSTRQQGIILVSMYPIDFNNNWVTSTTTSLAQQIYDKKDFSLMPILADALQDVDCNEEILNHLRSTGPFYKGNYIIDKLIGKRS